MRFDLPPTVTDREDPHWFRRERVGRVRLQPGNDQAMVFTIHPDKPLVEADTPAARGKDRNRRRSRRKPDVLMLQSVILKSAYPLPYR